MRKVIFTTHTSREGSKQKQMRVCLLCLLSLRLEGEPFQHVVQMNGTSLETEFLHNPHLDCWQ